MKYLLPLLGLALGLATRPATAQTTTLAPPGTEAPPASLTPAHRQAATALLNSMYSEASFNQLLEQMLQAQLKAQPTMQPYAGEYRAFLHKYMGWAALRPQMADIYAREFTQPELEELTRFYQSPVGRKATEKLPALMRSGMEMGQKTVQEHLPELTKAIQDKAKADHPAH